MFVQSVLILVLMEDTLRERFETLRKRGFIMVLILVLMEDTLRVYIVSALVLTAAVLILVLMEDTLRV